MAKAKGKGRKTKAANGAEPGIGHNFKVDRTGTRDAFKRVDALNDQIEDVKAKKAEKIGELNGDKRQLIEDVCNDLGCSQKAFKEVYKEHRDEILRTRRLEAMDDTDRDQADKLRQALETYASTPLGKAAIDRAERADAERQVTGA